MPTVFLVTVCVGLGTYAIRASSLSLGSRVSWPMWVKNWLSYVTPAVLGALLGPTIFMNGTHFVPVAHNAELIPAFITSCVAWWSKHLLWTVVTGVVSFVLISQWMS